MSKAKKTIQNEPEPSLASVAREKTTRWMTGKREKPNAGFSAPAVTPATAIPDGKVVDFLTGAFVNDTPEEYVRQNLEKALVRQYRYPPSQCRPEFRIKMGSAKPRVDIAVFIDGADLTQENIRIIVETKRAGTSAHDKKEGVDQLKSYMAACPNAQYGIWTNGSEERYCFAKRVKAGRILFELIIDLPGAGQTEEEAFRPQRKNLMPATADNLLFAFRRCHNYIAANEGMQKSAAFWELLKIIFCKIEDERSKSLRFFVTPAELTNATTAPPAKARIAAIMADSVVKKYPKIFSGADQELQLKPVVCAYVVQQLQSYSLLGSSVDVKGVAYEEVVGSNLRGDRGEFFTPRNACRMAVAMLAPTYEEKLLDPACGTGGFLITAMNFALDSLERSECAQWTDSEKPTNYERQELDRKRREFLSERVSGLDLNPALVRAAKMNMVMNNDGEGGLFQANSLENPHGWSPDAAARLPLGSVDVIFTNPPFGTKIVIDDEDTLSQYDLAAMWDKQDDGSWTIRRDKKGVKTLSRSQPPEILFIERCIQLLKPGTGRMAVVIPNGILNNPALEYVRYWILHHAQVLAVVDMARDLFQPHNDTQTSMVLLRRLSAEEESVAARSGLDYPVFMAIAERIGHDKRRNPIYRRHPDGRDMLVSRVETVLQLDPTSGEEVEREVSVSERVIDDELADVAASYQAWLAKQEK